MGSYFETVMYALGKGKEPFQASVSPSVKWRQRPLQLILKFKKVEVLKSALLQTEGKKMTLLRVRSASG